MNGRHCVRNSARLDQLVIERSAKNLEIPLAERAQLAKFGYYEQ